MKSLIKSVVIGIVIFVFLLFIGNDDIINTYTYIYLSLLSIGLIVIIVYDILEARAKYKEKKWNNEKKPKGK